MGAPIGNQNAVRAKRWTQAIERALDRRSRVGQIQALDELADKLLDAGYAGEQWALKELGDRIEGKPTQVVAGDAENPLELIGRIERVVVSSKD